MESCKEEQGAGGAWRLRRKSEERGVRSVLKVESDDSALRMAPSACAVR
jgi:hypothetical protein